MTVQNSQAVGTFGSSLKSSLCPLVDVLGAVVLGVQWGGAFYEAWNVAVHTVEFSACIWREEET